MQAGKKNSSDCLGQVNFHVGKEQKFGAQWAREIKISSPVSMSESVSLVNDNFQTENFQTEDCKMSDTISWKHESILNLSVHLPSRVTAPITILVKSSGYPVSIYVLVLLNTLL